MVLTKFVRNYGTSGTIQILTNCVPRTSEILKAYDFTAFSNKCYIGVRGVPERDIPSLGAMGWGGGGIWKFFRLRRRRRRPPPKSGF